MKVIPADQGPVQIWFWFLDIFNKGSNPDDNAIEGISVYLPGR